MASNDRRANGSTADDAEFKKLLDEMDELGRQADALRAKVNHLIDEMRENDVPPDEDSTVDDEAHGTASGDEAEGVAAYESSAVYYEAHGAASDEVSGEESDGIAVNGQDGAGSKAGDGDIAMDTDNAADGKATDEDAEPDAT